MAVYQFKSNAYESEFYDYERAEAAADFKAAYLADDLLERNQFILENLQSQDDSVKKKVNNDIAILRNELAKEDFNVEEYNKETGARVDAFLKQYKERYRKLFNEHSRVIEKKMEFLEKQGRNVLQEKNEYYSESLANMVTNMTTKNRLLEYQGQIIQQIDPIFQTPSTENPLNYRAAFFFPEKNLLGMTVSTFFFDLLVIWLMSGVAYLLLYFEAFRKLIAAFGKFKPY